MRTTTLLLAATLLLPVVASAQDEETPPADEPEQAPATGGARPLPAGHPTLGPGDTLPDEGDGGDEGGGADGDGGAADDSQGSGAMQLPSPPPASADAAADVPAGAIRVEVTDESGHPAPRQRVQLGVMGGTGEREHQEAQTGEDGSYTWRGLETGDSQAYRVTVPYQSATFFAEPFRLPPAVGYRVRIQRGAITRSPARVLQFVGRTIVEVRDERLMVTQQMQLANFGEATYVLPPRGLHFRLPDGFIAFQTEPAMNDVRLTNDETGVLMQGSIGPGQTLVVFGYQVPYSGSDIHLEAGIPLKTVIYDVIVEAAPGMSASAEGMPDMRAVQESNTRVLQTRLQRRPDSEAFDKLVLDIHGVPGPGWGRWLAVVLAFGLMGVGVVVSISSRGQRARSGDTAIEAEIQRLLLAVEELEARRRSGEVGPKTYDKQREAAIRQIAMLTREAERRAASRKDAAKKRA